VKTLRSRVRQRGRTTGVIPGFSRVIPIMLGMVLVFGTSSACASTLNIIPTFTASITNDPNAAYIEATINTAIAYYGVTFTTATASPINVAAS